MDATLEAIAKTVLGLETLETQNSDSADFKTLSVWELKQALQQAYRAGAQAARS